MLKLYHNDMSVCAQKVRCVLSHKQLDYEDVHFNLRAGEQLNPEFLKISPKGLIPILIHNEQVISESNVIIEYLEEVFPDNSLMPRDSVQRSRIRTWLVRLDAGLHEQVAVISFCIAFRYQLLERYKTEAEQTEFLNRIPDPQRKAVLADTLTNGMASPRLALAAYAYETLLGDMERALAKGNWLVGSQMSLADFGFIPYIDRLEQLQLKDWWSKRPALAGWIERMRATMAYQRGIGDWLNADYLKLMSDSGRRNWSKLAEILSPAT